MPGFELFGEEERKEVNDVLQSGILMRYNFDGVRNDNWKAKELEQAISTKFNIAHTHLTSSGTTALITVMSALGIGAGDEIIMPTFTFVASFEAILTMGSIPILVDIDETLTLDPIAVEKAITTRTKAIMPVHMCGAMAEMDALKAIADKHKIILLEDACQATGGSYKGKTLGTIGDAGCLSFDFVKTVTCGEGGAILTNNPMVYAKSDQYTDHGHDHIGMDRGAESHPIVGLNFRISELHAAVGLAQFRKLDTILAIQRKNKAILQNELKNLDVTFRKIPDETGDIASHLSVFFPSEEIARAAITALKEEKIGGCFYWYDNNWHYVKKWNHLKDYKTTMPLYKEQKDLLPDYATQDFSKSDAIMAKTITFAISLTWTEEQCADFAKKIKNILTSVMVKAS